MNKSLQRSTLRALQNYLSLITIMKISRLLVGGFHFWLTGRRNFPLGSRDSRNRYFSSPPSDSKRRILLAEASHALSPPLPYLTTAHSPILRLRFVVSLLLAVVLSRNFFLEQERNSGDRLWWPSLERRKGFEDNIKLYKSEIQKLSFDLAK